MVVVSEENLRLRAVIEEMTFLAERVRSTEGRCAPLSRSRVGIRASIPKALRKLDAGHRGDTQTFGHARNRLTSNYFMPPRT
jgi:hypothetical protein